MTKLRIFRLASSMQPKTDLYFLQSSLVNNRNDLYSIQADMAMGQDTLIYGETLFVVFTTDLNYTPLPLFTQSISNNLCCHTLFIKDTKFPFIVQINELMAASGWERDV